MAMSSKKRKAQKKMVKSKNAMRKQLKKLGISTTGLSKKQLNKRIKRIKLERAVLKQNAAKGKDPLGEDNSEELSHEEFRYLLPTNLRTYATDNLYSMVNELVSDPDVGSVYRDNIISFSKVLDPQFSNMTYKSGRAIQRYLTAVKFCTFKLMGATNNEAYARVYPERYAQKKRDGKVKALNKAIEVLAKSQMVMNIMELSLIPSHLMYQDYYNEAITKSVTLMRTSKSDRIQMESAHFLATHLAKPETAKLEVDIKTSESSALTDLRGLLKEMSQEQKMKLESGAATLDSVAKQSLIPKLINEEEDDIVEADYKPLDD